MKSSRNLLLILLALVIGIYLVYAGFYIYRTSFIASGDRYFVLFDDAMISMRYAKNLAEGQGLVWNPREQPVEGYTNPLWVLFMSLFHLFPFPAAQISLAIQISGAVFLSLNLFFVFKLTQGLSQKILTPLLAVILTAFYTPLNNWGLQGMEVSVLTFMITAVIFLVVKNLKEEISSPWPFIILGVGTLVRIDMAVSYLAVLGFLVIFDPDNRKNTLIWGLGTLIFFIIGQTIFRIWYYGEPLPNTYYLKMTGFPIALRIKRGLSVLFSLIKQMSWVLILLPFTILLYRRDRSILLLFLILGGQIAYSVYVGGDAWEHKGGSNRYIALAIPLFFILFVYAVEQILQTLVQKDKSGKPIIQWAANLTLVVFVLASMVNFNYLVNIRSLERWLLLRQPDFIEANKEYIDIVSELDQFSTPETRIAVVTAGAIPYFSNLPAIDLLGKNDPVIAQQPNHFPKKLSDIRPGHMKWDYDYAVGELKPDVIVQIWGDTETVEAYQQQYYVVVDTGNRLFTVREDSPSILWDRLTIQAE